MLPTESKQADLGELYRQAVADRDRLQKELDDMREHDRVRRMIAASTPHVDFNYTLEELLELTEGQPTLREYLDEYFSREEWKNVPVQR